MKLLNIGNISNDVFTKWKKHYGIRTTTMIKYKQNHKGTLQGHIELMTNFTLYVLNL